MPVARTETKRKSSVKSIRALARGVQVLRRLQQSGGLSLNDLHRATGLPRATLLRILLTLENEGLVWRRIVDDAFLASHSVIEKRAGSEEEARLAEVASPLLEALTNEIKWPSILAVPRLTHMEVIEATAPRSYFHHIELGPVGFQVNILLSATGRAYLAYCPDEEREATLDRLRHSQRSGDKMAHDRRWINDVLAKTRKQGFGARDPRFGGNFDLTRRDYDDGRDSLAVPIMLSRRVIGCINVTWIRRVTTQAKVVSEFLKDVQMTAADMASQIAAPDLS